MKRKISILSLCLVLTYLFVQQVCAGTYTPNHNFYKIDYGENISKWWTKSNNNWDTVDKYLSKIVDGGQYSSLNAAVAANQTKTVFISSTLPLTANLTVPATCHLIVYKGGLINLNGYILTFNGPTFSADFFQTFSGTGSVTIPAMDRYPQWWGAKGDGNADDSPAIQACIDSVPIALAQGERGKGATIYFIPGIYLCNTGLINNGRKISIVGSSMDNTTLKKGVNDIDLLKVDSFVQYQTIRDMTFDGDNKTGLSLLYLNTPNNMLLAELNIIGSNSTVSALYLQQATVTTLRNIQITNNKKSACFYQVNAGTIYNLNVMGRLGSLINDLEFVGASGTFIYGISLSDETAIQVSSCTNFNIFGLYQETPLSNPAITIGAAGAPCKGVNITGVNATVVPVEPPSVSVNNGPLIRVQLSSFGISIKDVFITQNQTITPLYAGGWIELGEVFGVTIDNIVLQSLTTGQVSGAKAIFTSSVGPDNVTINNVQAYSAASTIEMLLADNLRITNCNIPITIGGNCTDVVLQNCTGAITDSSDKATILDKQIAVNIGTLANSATPSVAGRSYWLTGGTTTITDFTLGKIGQIITILAEHTITITDGLNIFLNGSVNFGMVATGSLTLIKKTDGKWYEISRAAN